MDTLFTPNIPDEAEDIPQTDEPVWILGRKYNAIKGLINEQSTNIFDEVDCKVLNFRARCNTQRYSIQIMVYLSKRLCSHWWLQFYIHI